MEAIIPAGIALLQQLVSSSSLTSVLIKSAVEFVVAVAPVVVKEYQDLKPIVSNIITALKASPEALPDQLAALQAAEVLLDSNFETAAAKSLEEDKTATD
jgi:hypothetical protein